MPASLYKDVIRLMYCQGQATTQHTHSMRQHGGDQYGGGGMPLPQPLLALR
jgi:hypothetical protein